MTRQKLLRGFVICLCLLAFCVAGCKKEEEGPEIPKAPEAPTAPKAPEAPSTD